MTDRPRRPASLLDLAIIASTAVVPVLLGVLLMVASAREADTLAPSRAAPGNTILQPASGQA